MSITLLLIIATSLISYQAFGNRELFLKFKHWPYEEARTKDYIRWLSSGFLHGSWMHLLINMYVLYIFGEVVEARFLGLFGPTIGRIVYFLFYILAIVAADIPTFIKHKNNPSFSSVGASGAVSAIVFAFILFYPWAQLLLFFIIPMPAIVAGVLYLVYSSYASRNSQDLIDHDAHFFGAVFGILFLSLLKPEVFFNFLHLLVGN